MEQKARLQSDPLEDHEMNEHTLFQWNLWAASSCSFDGVGKVSIPVWTITDQNYFEFQMCSYKLISSITVAGELSVLLLVSVSFSLFDMTQPWLTNVKYQRSVPTSSTNVHYQRPVPTSSTNVQYQPPVVTSSTNVQYLHPVPTSSTNAQYQHPVTTSSTYIQYQHLVPTPSTNI